MSWINKFAIVVILLLPVSIAYSDETNTGKPATETKQETLAEALNKLKTEFQNNPEKSEADCLELINKFKTPEEKGKIYMEIWDMYWRYTFTVPVQTNNFQKNADIMIKYCKMALECPLSVLDMIKMYDNWGESLSVKYEGATGKMYLDVRKEIIIPYLHEFKIILDNQTASKKQYIAHVDGFCVDGPPGTDEAIRKINTAQMAARAQEDFQNSIIDHREGLVHRIVDLYAQWPYATDELSQLATEILKKDDVAKDLIAKVEAQIKVNEGKDKKPVLVPDSGSTLH
jgi:hypothetical protein